MQKIIVTYLDNGQVLTEEFDASAMDTKEGILTIFLNNKSIQVFNSNVWLRVEVKP